MSSLCSSITSSSSSSSCTRSREYLTSPMSKLAFSARALLLSSVVLAAAAGLGMLQVVMGLWMANKECEELKLQLLMYNTEAGVVGFPRRKWAPSDNLEPRNQSDHSSTDQPSAPADEASASSLISHIQEEAGEETVFTLREMTGWWIGNTWVPPPGWRYYPAHEIRQLYQHKRVWWMGDSTARRAALTWYAMMNDTSLHPLEPDINHPSVIDVNRRHIAENCTIWPHDHKSDGDGNQALLQVFRPHICRPLPPGSNGQGRGIMKITQVNCFHEVETFIHAQLDGQIDTLRDIDVLIIGTGVWDSIRSGSCHQSNRTREKILARTVTALHAYAQQTNLTIIWRTVGYPDVGKGDITHSTISWWNDQVMDQIDLLGGGTVTAHQPPSRQGRPSADGLTSKAPPVSHLTYVHWAGAVEPRSWRGERIAGDIEPHYGLEPRIVLVQMITNLLHDRGFFD